MTAEKLVRKMKLSDADFAAIKDAVAREESRTTGEIALTAIPESSDYSFFELLASVILGAVAFAALLPLYGALAGFIDRMFWHVSAWYLPAAYGVISFAVIALFFAVANIPAIDRIVIPRASRKRAVYNRALKAFLESGVYATKERTGILIFVSWMEREVRIVADEGISAKIEQEEWDGIARDLAKGIKEGNAADACTLAVHRCGNLLAGHFPAKAENPNELPDGLVILEAGA
jgi:putative membrane protein